MDAKAIIETLKGKSYQQLAEEMKTLETDTLLELLNGKSRMVGNTASELLNKRDAEKQLTQAIKSGKFTTRDGKIRAANTLVFAQAQSVEADQALLFLVHDKNKECADNALFGLVALRQDRVISELEKMGNAPQISTNLKAKIALAIEALKLKDPKIYSPYYGG